MQTIVFKYLCTAKMAAGLGVRIDLGAVLDRLVAAPLAEQPQPEPFMMPITA